jgi:hypothetical protein
MARKCCHRMVIPNPAACLSRMGVRDLLFVFPIRPYVGERAKPEEAVTWTGATAECIG